MNRRAGVKLNLDNLKNQGHVPSGWDLVEIKLSKNGTDVVFDFEEVVLAFDWTKHLYHAPLVECELPPEQKSEKISSMKEALSKITPLSVEKNRIGIQELLVQMNRGKL